MKKFIIRWLIACQVVVALHAYKYNSIAFKQIIYTTIVMLVVVGLYHGIKWVIKANLSKKNFKI